MWNLPVPGTAPVFPALAGGFFNHWAREVLRLPWLYSWLPPCTAFQSRAGDSTQRAGQSAEDAGPEGKFIAIKIFLFSSRSEWLENTWIEVQWAASASPGNLFGRQILGPCLRPAESDTPKLWPRKLFFIILPGWSWCIINSKVLELLN